MPISVGNKEKVAFSCSNKRYKQKDGESPEDKKRLKGSPSEIQW